MSHYSPNNDIEHAHYHLGVQGLDYHPLVTAGQQLAVYQAQADSRTGWGTTGWSFAGSSPSTSTGTLSYPSSPPRALGTVSGSASGQQARPSSTYSYGIDDRLAEYFKFCLGGALILGLLYCIALGMLNAAKGYAPEVFAVATHLLTQAYTGLFVMPVQWGKVIFHSTSSYGAVLAGTAVCFYLCAGVAFLGVMLTGVREMVGVPRRVAFGALCLAPVALYVVCILVLDVGALGHYVIHGLGKAPGQSHAQTVGDQRQVAVPAGDKEGLLNLREGAGRWHKAKYQLRNGQMVTLLGETQKVEGATWMKIKYENHTGWVNSRYVEAIRNATLSHNVK